MDFRNLFTRAWVGAILVLIIIGSVLFSVHTLAALLVVLTVLLVLEFHTLTNVDGTEVCRWNAALCSASLPLSIYFFLTFTNSFLFLMLLVYPIWVTATLASELWRKKEKPLHNLAFFTFGQLYITVPLSLLAILAMSGMYDGIIILSLFVFIWVNDTFAYLTGSLLGRHKLFERISPKKSVEGFIGGNVFAILAAYIFSIFFTELSWWQWLCLAEIVVIFGTLGDFFESLIKRTLGVKDSGNSIPGHGGWLDRFDSFVFAIVPSVLFLFLIWLL